MRKLLVLIISCLCFTSIWANSAEGSAQNQDASNNNIENAAQAYAQKDYIKAAQLYASLLNNEEVKQDEAMRAAIYYNLGNCQYRTKNFAQAVWAFQSALRLNPADKDALHNLQLTQSKLQDEFDEPAYSFFVLGFRNVVTLISANAWGACAIALLILACASFFLFKLAEKMWVRKTGFCLSCMALMGTLCAFLFAYVQKNYYFNEMQAVTLQSEKTFSNPSATSKAMKELHEGVLLNIEQRQSDGWMQVTLPDGTACWLKSNNLLMLND